jgi:serine/threonine protein kinase
MSKSEQLPADGGHMQTLPATSGENLEVGKVLDGTYELVEPIGAGGMGVVWRARHRRLPKQVAIKVLLRAARNEELETRFRREAEIIARLRHPNIVEVLDFNTLPDHSPYMVLELLHGRDLHEHMASRALPLGEVCEIVRQTAAGLQVAHRNGVVHRDLKPENLFLCELDSEEPLQVKILDFGISKLQTADVRLTAEKVVAGTPLYMAPEQAKGELGTVDARSDQYALAAIAFEMLTGETTFAGKTPHEVMFKVVYEEPRNIDELAPDLPPNIRRAIRRAMAKKREERFDSVAAFCREFLRHRSEIVSLPTAPGEGPSLLSGATGPMLAANASGLAELEATAKASIASEPLASAAETEEQPISQPPLDEDELLRETQPESTPRFARKALGGAFFVAMVGLGLLLYFALAGEDNTPPASPKTSTTSAGGAAHVPRASSGRSASAGATSGSSKAAGVSELSRLRPRGKALAGESATTSDNKRQPPDTSSSSARRDKQRKTSQTKARGRTRARQTIRSRVSRSRGSRSRGGVGRASGKVKRVGEGSGADGLGIASRADDRADKKDGATSTKKSQPTVTKEPASAARASAKGPDKKRC